jgi:menaquinone-dependent protoporphyrinogen IX oxidase
MKTIVVYKSRSGFVRRYAQWIAEELAADLLEGSKVSADKLAEYDIVIYGGGLYEAGINGVKLITANMEQLRGRKLIVFASGASPAKKDAMDHVISHNFKAEQLEQLRFFYLRGGFDFSKLTIRDKLLMTLLKWKIKWKKARNIPLIGDEIGMLAAYDKPADFTKRKNIAELVEYAKQ